MSNIKPSQATLLVLGDRILEGFARGDFEIHFPRRLTWPLKLARLLPYRWYFALVGRFTGSARAESPHDKDDRS